MHKAKKITLHQRNLGGMILYSDSELKKNLRVIDFFVHYPREK